MKNILLIVFISFGTSNLIGQSISFEFTAKTKAEVLLGKNWDYSYTNLKNPIKISFKDNRLLMVYETGKVFWDLNVLNTIITKETVENGKTIEQNIALEYKDKNDFTTYIIFEYKNEFGDKYYTLKLPYISNGWVFSYNYYSN